MTIKNFWASINPFSKKGMTVIQSWGMGGTVSFPGTKGEYIQDGYEGSSTVYAIENIIGETFASAPKTLYRVKSQKALDKYKILTKSYGASPVEIMRAKSAAMEEVDGHPLLDLLNKPNGLQGAFDFLVHVNASRDITGDTFIWVNRGLSGKGEPLSLTVLPSQYINLKTSSPYTVEGYQLNYGTPKDFSPDEVVHWRYTNLAYDAQGQHLFGQSPLKALSEDYTLTANKAGKKSAAKGYENQGAGGLLSRNEDFPWTDEQRIGLNDYIDEVINGSENRLKVRAANAKLQWVQLAMSAADQKIFEGIQATKEDICNVFNFPVHLLSASAGTFSNVDAANKYLVTKTVYGRWISFRDLVNNKLLPMYKGGEQYFFDFDISTFPEVQDDQRKLYDLVREAYWITPEEKREYLGWEASNDPNMKKFYFPSSLTPLDQLNVSPEDIGQDVEDLEDEGIKDYK
jgi:HK97 family phage portal protein